MILELSAAYSAISDADTTELGLRRRPMPEGIAGTVVNGQEITSLARSPSVVLGRLRANNFEFLLLPHKLRGDPVPDGILGLDLLRGQDMELDLSHSKLNLFSRNHCEGKVVYWNPSGGVAAIPLIIQKTGNMLINMLLDGRPVVVGITSTGQSEMGMNAVRRLFGLDEHAPGMEATPQSRTSPGDMIYRYPFKTISVEGLSIAGPAILVRGEEPGPECDAKLHTMRQPGEGIASGGYEMVRCYGGADLFIGLSVLRKLHLYFAFGEKILYATAADAP
jgi:hypothetical protein